MRRFKWIHEEDVKDLASIAGILIMVLGVIVWTYFGKDISFGRDISLQIYKNKVVRYIDTQGYSERTKEILYVAVDNIRYPENISDYKIISIMPVGGPTGTFSLVTSEGYKEVVVDEDDWYVIIGETTLHKYYNAIIDSEKLEYLGSVPIA